MCDVLSGISRGSKYRLVYSKEMKYKIMDKIHWFSLKKICLVRFIWRLDFCLCCLFKKVHGCQSPRYFFRISSWILQMWLWSFSQPFESISNKIGWVWCLRWNLLDIKSIYQGVSYFLKPKTVQTAAQTMRCLLSVGRKQCQIFFRLPFIITCWLHSCRTSYKEVLAMF